MLKVAVLDPDEEYLKQLSAYMMVKRNSSMEVNTYSRWDDFWIQEPQKEYDAIVISVTYWDKISKMQKNPKIILLCDDEIPLEAEDMSVVLKYQAVSSMMSAIAELPLAGGQKDEQWINAIKGEVIGVYSPVSHEGQMMFSMTLSQLLGEDKKVLYLNFMENSGFSQIYHIEAARGLSDILMAVMGQRDITHAVSCAAVPIGRTDCILPAQYPEHLLEFSDEHYLRLFHELGVHSGYDIVIADFGKIFPGFMKVLQQCSSVYCIGEDSYMGRCRIQEFDDYTKKWESTADKLCKLILPIGLASVSGDDFLQKGIFGSMGDYIRKNVLGGGGFE